MTIKEEGGVEEKPGGLNEPGHFLGVLVPYKRGCTYCSIARMGLGVSAGLRIRPPGPTGRGTSRTGTATAGQPGRSQDVQ